MNILGYPNGNRVKQNKSIGKKLFFPIEKVRNTFFYGKLPFSNPPTPLSMENSILFKGLPKAITGKKKNWVNIIY